MNNKLGFYSAILVGLTTSIYFYGVIALVILSTQVFPLMAYTGATWILTMPLSSSLIIFLFRQEIQRNIKMQMD